MPNSSVFWCVVLCGAIGLIDRLAATADITAAAQQSNDEEPKFVVIKEDVIPDKAENTTQKVIRVNPLDLPSLHDDPAQNRTDSDLYKIQSILPPSANRKYINSHGIRKPRPQTAQTAGSVDAAQFQPGDSPILRYLPNQSKVHKPKHQRPDKKKHLHFLYNQEALDGRVIGKSMRVHVAPGAYPIFYAVSKTNGRFGKFPIKGFRNQNEFLKYLMKSKLEPIALKDRYDS